MRHEIDHSTGYPMHFIYERTGDVITLNVCHNEEIQKNDIMALQYTGIPAFQIADILEKRQPCIPTDLNPNNKNHHPKGVMFYRVRGVVINK